MFKAMNIHLILALIVLGFPLSVSAQETTTQGKTLQEIFQAAAQQQAQQAGQQGTTTTTSTTTSTTSTTTAGQVTNPFLAVQQQNQAQNSPEPTTAAEENTHSTNVNSPQGALSSETENSTKEDSEAVDSEEKNTEEPKTIEDKPIEKITGSRAEATIKGTLPNSKISGSITIGEASGGLSIDIKLAGVPNPGPHGIHFNTGSSCDNPGEIFDASKSGNHLGNAKIDNYGAALEKIFLPNIKLSELSGKTFTISEKEDDLSTQPDGNSGRVIACGAIVGTQQ